MEIKWEDLLDYEPELRALEKDVRNAEITKDNIHWEWSKKFKPRLLRLVGFGARSKYLNSTWAYDTAYQHLYEILEDKAGF